MNVWIDVYLVLSLPKYSFGRVFRRGRLWCDIAVCGIISYKNRSNHCNNYSVCWFVISFSDICIIEKDKYDVETDSFLYGCVFLP